MSDYNNEADRNMGFDAETGTYRVCYEESASTLSYTLVTTVSAVSGDAPQSMDPLHEAIDTDALNTLFDSSLDGQTLGDGRVVFEYEGFEVTVRSDGILEVRPTDETRMRDLNPSAV